MTPSSPALRPWIAQCWATAGCDSAPRRWERVLPTGHAHLVLRFGGAPVRVLPASGAAALTLPEAVLGGARQTAYEREFSVCATVGLVLRPGALQRLFGVSAAEMAGRHTPLEDVAGQQARLLHERLSGLPDPQARLLALLEWAAMRLQTGGRHRGALHPAAAHALQHIDSSGVAPHVAELVRASGYSHRHFNAVFEQAAGLKPMAYLRVRRLQRALREADGPAPPDWAGVAQSAGYADQPHLNRDFALLTGMTPGQWQRLRSSQANHVPLPSIRDQGQIHPRRGR